MLRSLRAGGVAIGLFASVVLVASCADQRATGLRGTSASVVPIGGGPVIASAQLPPVRISEFHYDNASTDVGEAIEVSFPTGTNLAGYSIVLYNGDNNATTGLRPYGSARALNGANATVTGCADGRSVVVLTYPQDGIQNGSPDGIALVGPSGVVEFLSYEGSFTAISGTAGGPAAGMTATDIGKSEAGSTTIGFSLQRSGTDTWSDAKQNTFGSCNDSDEPPPPQEIDTVRVTPKNASVIAGATQQFAAQALDASKAVVPTATFSWSIDDHNPDAVVATVDANGLVTTFLPGDVTVTATTPNSKSDTGHVHIEAAVQAPAVRFSEIHYDNNGTDANESIEIEGPAGTDLTNWSVVLYDGTGSTAYSTRALDGAITSRAACNGRGVVVLTYPVNGIQNGAPDGFALVNGDGAVVEFFSYEGTFTAADGPAAGKTSISIGVEEGSSTTSQQSLQRSTDGASWSAPSASSFGRCNLEGPTPPENGISFSGRLTTDPALPVGFEDQLFATLRDGSTNEVINTTFTWTAVTPDIATIDANGVMHAVSTGAATFRATAADGTSATYTLQMADPQPSTTAVWTGNSELGDPIGTNDVIIRRDQFTSSYSRTRNIPNWVSAKLEGSHFGAGVDRCDCFTYDPKLPADYPRYTTGDYTGAGAFAGYGIDRGHLLRSFDVTASDGDNKFSYLFSNIIPQSHDMNTGAWAVLEDSLGKLARSTYDVYMVAGASGSKGTVKGEGKITIPAQVWKVALVVPHGTTRADIHSASDIIDVFAVIMPNDPGTNADWKTYKTTIDAVEALSGYDVFALLDDQIEIAIESNTKPPTAAVDGPYTGSEGSAVSMSAAGSSDPDHDVLTYAWDFGDRSSPATGVSVSHTYAQNGTYTVTLRATDTRGLYNEVTTTTTVNNVAPSIGAFAGATLLPGETYTASGSFTDPGADTWTGSVNYGDGSGPAPLGLLGKSFSLSHTYESAGSYSVVVQITDDQTTSSRGATVTVLTQAQGVRNIIAMVDDLGANSLRVKLDAAAKQLDTGKPTPAANQLEAFLNELDAMARTGRMSPTDAETLRQAVARVLRSVTR